MSISKVESGYRVDVRPSGRNGRRYRKVFSTKAEAVKFEKFILGQHHDKAWLDAPVDRRPFSELIELWFKYHGKTLKEGTATYNKLQKSCADMGNPKIFQIDKKFYLNYRAERLEKITPKTANLELERLRAVFSIAISSGEFSGEHPLNGIPPVKQPAKELSFLTCQQIDYLLSLLTGDMHTIVCICLCTGARWSEAQNLTSSQVLTDRLTFIDTKNGKNRTIPITQEMRRQIPSDRSGQLFDDCYKPFLKILSTSEIKLPKGQASHVLRHTFASHFVMNGGNILTLQKILGHSNIQMTMRYAHLAPEHLLDATRYNPLVLNEMN